MRLLSDDNQGLEIAEEDNDSGVALAALRMMTKGASQVRFLDSDDVTLIRWTVMERSDDGTPLRVVSELMFTDSDEIEMLYPE